MSNQIDVPTLRERAAMEAMKGFVSHYGNEVEFEALARWSVEVADKLVKELGKSRRGRKKKTP